MKTKRNHVQINKTTILKFSLCLATILLLVAPSNTANAASNVLAYNTQQSITVDGVANEPLWSQIPSTNVPLTKTTPYGGSVSSISIKASHNATHVFLLLQWADSKESRTESGSKRLANSVPGNLSGRFFYNSTWVYPDAAVVDWWMGSDKPTVKPAAVSHFGGSPQRQTKLFGWGPNDRAESWTWKAWVLDLGAPYYPDAGMDRGASKYHWGAKAGQPLLMPYSSLYQGLYNATGNWVLGDGLLHSKGCQQPGTVPFDVRAHGVWSGGVWTLEIARSLTTPSAQNRPYTQTFVNGNTYYFTLAAYNGDRGENEEVGSLSDWLTLQLSPQLAPAEQQSQQLQSAASDASKVASVAQQAATDAQKVATSAQQAAASGQQFGQAATAAAQQALAAAQDARTAVQNSTNIAYAAIAVAVVSVLFAAFMGLRRKS